MATKEDSLIFANCEIAFLMKKTGVMDGQQAQCMSVETFEDSRITQTQRISRSYRVTVTHAGSSTIAVRYEDGLDSGEGDYGVYITEENLTVNKDYFEIEMICTKQEIGIMLVPYTVDVTCLKQEAVAYWSSGSIVAFDHEICAPKYKEHDRIGCGIKFTEELAAKQSVFFTKNGEQVHIVTVSMPVSGFYPAVCLKRSGELLLYARKKAILQDDLMHISTGYEEEKWRRLHYIKQMGQVLSYAGQSKSVRHVGLAQASKTLNIVNHYFELEILDSGENCYIAIGLTHKAYPSNRHPGWSVGSVAYHADDGKVFTGSGIGQRFAQRCEKGDIMGCGIYFPINWVPTKLTRGLEQSDIIWAYEEENSHSSDETEKQVDELLKQLQNSPKVKVYFTRNHKLVGSRNVKLPNGEYYPTIGMLSSEERVKVDLNPAMI